MPEESQLRAEVDGFAENLLKDLPETVEKDTPVVKIHDPLLDGKVKLLSARLLELDARFRAEWDIDRIRAENAKEEMRVVAEELKQAKKRQQSMQIVSKKAGKLLIPQAEDLTGRFVRKGEIIGYVMDETLPTVRVIVTQSDMGLVQTGVKAVEIRLSNHPRQTIPAGIVRKAPEATNYLPSAALATIHGGKIAVDPDSKGGLKTREKVFQLELEFSSLANNYEIGQRVHVRFDHGSEPLGWQWYRRFRQVFLRQFNV